jgi:ribosomal-protein-alanine N-acetyltransferase
MLESPEGTMTSEGPFPILETERLVLRVPSLLDAVAMTSFVTENRRHLQPWEPTRSPEYYTMTYWEEHLPRILDKVRHGSRLDFLLYRREQPESPVQGRCSFTNIQRGPFQAATLGYALDHRAVGQGLMSEALRAAIDYCFEDLHLHRIMANYMPSNVRSANLLRGLGFVVEGVAKDYLLLDGAWRDHVLTSKRAP